MNRHSLYNHVIPQITTLKNASYGQDEAFYIYEKNATFDLSKLTAMMRGDPPNVLVLVDKLDKEWEREIKRTGAQLIAFEVYRSELNNHIFRVSGKLSYLDANIITYLEPDHILPRFVNISSPAALDFNNGARINVLFNGQLTSWKRVDTGRKTYLSCLGRMPLRKGLRYVLKALPEGQYIIEQT